MCEFAVLFLCIAIDIESYVMPYNAPVVRLYSIDTIGAQQKLKMLC